MLKICSTIVVTTIENTKTNGNYSTLTPYLSFKVLFVYELLNMSFSFRYSTNKTMRKKKNTGIFMELFTIPFATKTKLPLVRREWLLKTNTHTNTHT